MTTLRCVAAFLLLAACLRADAQATPVAPGTPNPLPTADARLVHPDLPKTDIPFERLLSQPYLAGSPPADARWAKDNHHIAFRWNPQGNRLRDIYVLDVPGGKPVRLTEGVKIVRLARQDDERTEDQKKEEVQYDAGPGAPIWSPDSKTILFGYRGDIFEVGIDGKTAPRRRTMLTEGVGQLDYSPDGKFISYARGGNIYLLERQTGDIRQLTTVSKPGTAVSGYDWSPDGKNLLVSWADSSTSKTVIIPDYTKDMVTTTPRQRAIVGQSQNIQKVGIVSASGDGLIKWVDSLAANFWNNGTDWSPDGKRVALSEMSGDFKTWRLRVFDIATRIPLLITQEKSTRFINDWHPVKFSLDGKTIYYGSDTDGWRHIWQVGSHGGNAHVVTPGNYDVGGFDRPDQSANLFVETTERGPLQLRSYCLLPDGKKVELTGSLPISAPTFATGAGLRGTHPSEDGSRAILDAQDRTHPPDLYFADVSSLANAGSRQPHPEPRRLTESQLPDFARVPLVKPQEITFAAPDGKILHALIWLPPGVSAGSGTIAASAAGNGANGAATGGTISGTNNGTAGGTKHGAIVSNMYADSAKDRWAGLLQSYMASALNMVVLEVDFRSSWGYGADFATGYYKSLGQVDADEAVAAANYLKSQPYVDGSRVGLWGWSYGGFLTEMVMFTRPGVFAAGVAVAPVTDWKHYNSWYTRHRLDEPKEAEDAYKKASPINFANGLQGHLLMIHGMQDDNVLFQDTVQMTQKLIEAGKDFEVAFYPKDDHSIGRDDSRVHVYRRIVKYLYMWLG